MTIIDRLREEKVIAIVRGIEPDKVLKVADALYDGGIRFMEITYNQKDPSSWIKTAEGIKAIKDKYEDKMYVGAGTVTSVELVELTYNHRGEYIISPDTDVNVIKRTKELGMLSLPGALTPSEIKVAYNAGADFVKVFPVGNMGPSYIKALKAPLSHIEMMAVGGVNKDNVQDYLKAGCCGAGVGGNLAKKEWIENGEFDKLKEAARELVEAVKSYK